MHYLANITPLWAVVVISMVIAAVLVYTFSAIKGRWWSFLSAKDHNDMTVVLVRVLSALYTILLGLTLISLWANFNEARKHVIVEANNYRQVIENSNSFSEPARSQIQSSLKNYIKLMATDDWHVMREGLPETEAVDKAIDEVYKAFSHYEPANKSQQLFYGQMLENFNKGLDERAQRLSMAKSNAPGGVRLIMVFNAIVLILVMCLLGSNYVTAQRNKIALVSSVIIMSLIFAFILDYPFAGEIAVSAEPLLKVLNIQPR